MAETTLATTTPSPVWQAAIAQILERDDFVQVSDPRLANAILLEEAFSFKEWRYIKKLKSDPVVGLFPHKTFTLNSDDSGAGLLRGIYTSLPASCFDPLLHRAAPLLARPNERVLERRNETREVRKHLACWRGNPKSHQVRRKLLSDYGSRSGFRVESTESWYDHQTDEKDTYVDLLLSSKFSLCPTGWGPATFRLYESMALGIAPVIIARQFVPPIGPDWPSFSIILPEQDISSLEKVLVEREPDYLAMGRRAKEAWNTFFSPETIAGYFAKTLLDCIFSSKGVSRESELRRWNSFPMYWKNRWTIPQRIQNRLVNARN